MAKNWDEQYIKQFIAAFNELSINEMNVSIDGYSDDGFNIEFYNPEISKDIVQKYGLRGCVMHIMPDFGCFVANFDMLIRKSGNKRIKVWINGKRSDLSDGDDDMFQLTREDLDKHGYKHLKIKELQD